MTDAPNPLPTAENGLRLSVVTITCRACGRVLSQSIPRVSEPDEIDSEAPCSPAFAQWASCPDHPAGPPDQGLRYSQDALPLMWTVRCVIPSGGAVDPEWIKAQREAGWPDMHPEDYCHRCGGRNPNWWTDADTWLTATATWAAETGREGICCPRCLIAMHEAATGHPVQWQLVRVFPPGSGAERSPS